MSVDHALLRKTLRAQRRGLGAVQRRISARSLTRTLMASTLIRRSRHFAVFLPNDGELDLRPAVRRLWRAGKRCYLPALSGHRLRFLPYAAGSPLRRNRYGIPEPALRHHRHWRDLRALDVVLVPLVAFDGRGNRLGMGGGYYDRTFAYLARARLWHRPLLIGVGYRFQRVGALPERAWDVPLAGVLTEDGLEWLRRPRSGPAGHGRSP